MFKPTLPSRARSKPKGPKKVVSNVQVNRLKNELNAAKKKFKTRQNTQSHIAAIQRDQAMTYDSGVKIQPLSEHQQERIKNGAYKLDNAFFLQQQRENKLLRDAVTPTKGKYQNPRFAKKGNNNKDDEDREHIPLEPKSHSKPRTVVEQHAAKIGGVDTRPHVRSVWYMAPVDGIAETPTALGRTPLEYQHTKYFIPDPTITPGLAKLARHPRIRIKTIGFKDLNPDEQQKALTSLDLPHPSTLHRNEPFPHLHYFTAPLLKDRSPLRSLRLHTSESRAFKSPLLAVTAFSINQVPRLRHHTRDVEIVFVGRSNVGKSSLINTLSHSDVAKTGRTPGKTQSLNFYALHPEALRGHRASAAALARASQVDTDRIYNFVSKLDPALTLPLTQAQESSINACYKRAGNGPVMMLVDVPGYGHANAPDWIVDKWNVMLGSYLRLRSPLNFPIDDQSYWTTKEYIEELDKLRRNRALPRKANPKNNNNKKNKKNKNKNDIVEDDYHSEYDDDSYDDYDDDDDTDEVWDSDVEQDGLKLFQQALNTHVDQMKYHLERRVANYETLMQKFNELEEMEKHHADSDVIYEKRMELLELQAKLEADLAENDPLNSTVTNLPTDWDDDGHNKFRQEQEQKVAIPSRYAKRTRAVKKNDDEMNKNNENTNIDLSSSSPSLSTDSTISSPPTTTNTINNTNQTNDDTLLNQTTATKRPMLRVRPRVVSRSTPQPSPFTTSTIPIDPSIDQDIQSNQSYKPFVDLDENNNNNNNDQDDKKMVAALLAAENDIDNEPKPMPPRVLRLLSKRGGRNTRPLPPDMVQRAVDTKPEASAMELMKNYRQLQLLGTQLDKFNETQRFQPIQSRLPPLEHLGPLHGSPLKKVVVLIDSRAGVTKYDLQFLNFLEKFQISHQVVLTKIDRLTNDELEGAAYSVAQSLFPHEFVKMLQKTQPLSLAAFPEGKLPVNSPTFTIKSAEQDKLWEASLKHAPRKFCSPLLIGVSSEKRLNIEVLQRSLLHGIFERI